MDFVENIPELLSEGSYKVTSVISAEVRGLHKDNILLFLRVRLDEDTTADSVFGYIQVPVPKYAFVKHQLKDDQIQIHVQFEWVKPISLKED